MRRVHKIELERLHVRVAGLELQTVEHVAVRDLRLVKRHALNLIGEVPAVDIVVDDRLTGLGIDVGFQIDVDLLAQIVDVETVDVVTVGKQMDISNSGTGG